MQASGRERQTEREREQEQEREREREREIVLPGIVNFKPAETRSLALSIGRADQPESCRD